MSVNFPVATPSEAIDVPFDQDTVYAIYVFDSTQGSDNTADWAFGTAPAYGITGMLGTTTLGEWRVVELERGAARAPGRARGSERWTSAR